MFRIDRGSTVGQWIPGDQILFGVGLSLTPGNWRQLGPVANQVGEILGNQLSRWGSIIFGSQFRCD